jgi:hypothetical protein
VTQEVDVMEEVDVMGEVEVTEEVEMTWLIASGLAERSTVWHCLSLSLHS